MLGNRKTFYVLSMEDCHKVEDAVNQLYGTIDLEDPMNVNFIDDVLCEQEYGTYCYVNLNINEEIKDVQDLINSEHKYKCDIRRYRLLKYLRENIPSEIKHLLVEVNY